MKKQGKLEQVALTPASRFKFLCHKGIKCFTQCCREVDMILTPFDIIRMKNRLKLSCDEFLLRYTTPEVLEKTKLPMARLVMNEDEDKKCPFVTEAGCRIYEDRPVICRSYPIGMGTLMKQGATEEETFSFMVKEPHCLGFNEDKEWSIQEWREDQGIDLYDKMNQGWMDIIMKKKAMSAAGSTAELSDKSLQMFFMISTNVDKLKGFIFETKFLQVYDIHKDIIEKIKSDEVELMKFGFDWLKDVFFGKNIIKVRGEALKKKG